LAAQLGEGGVTGTSSIPNPDHDLQKIRFDIPPTPGDLASKITEGFMRTYREERGLPVSEEHREAIEQLATTIQMMAESNPNLPPLFLLSTLPTGAGKTTLMVEAVKAIVADPAYSHVGIVLFVSYLSQIPILVKEMGLREDQYAVRTGKKNKELNELGLTRLMKTETDRKSAHRYAQVLFTTHAKVRAVAVHQKNFTNSPFFKYNNVTRQVRIWDEAILPADPIVLTASNIEEYVRRLKGWDETKAAAMLEDWVTTLSHAASDGVAKMPLFMLQMPFPPDDVDDDLEPVSERTRELYESDLAQTMHLLAGQKLRVHYDAHTGTTAISYRESLPLEFAPLLILDAGGELAMTYHAWGEGRGNLRQLPSVNKTYVNLTSHYWNHRAGKTAHRDNKIIDELASGVASAITHIRKENKNEDILVIHRLPQKPYSDLKKRIKKAVRGMGEDTEGISFLHYGCHTATNNFQNTKHVIVVGLLQYSDPEYHALWRAAKGVSVHVPALKDEVATLRLGTIKTHLLQAVGRSAVRKMVDGDVPEGCHLWIVFSSWATGKGGVSPEILLDTFPRTKLCRWQPLPEKLRPGAERVVNAASAALAEQEEVEVCLRDLAAQAGLTWAPTQGHLRKPNVLRELCRRGITVEGPQPISPRGIVTLRRGCQQRPCEPVVDDPT
jgi:hypothetical protein